MFRALADELRWLIPGESPRLGKGLYKPDAIWCAEAWRIVRAVQIADSSGDIRRLLTAGRLASVAVSPDPIRPLSCAGMSCGD
jgi:hypothetical protein